MGSTNKDIRNEAILLFKLDIWQPVHSTKYTGIVIPKPASAWEELIKLIILHVTVLAPSVMLV